MAKLHLLKKGKKKKEEKKGGYTDGAKMSDVTMFRFGKSFADRMAKGINKNRKK